MRPIKFDDTAEHYTPDVEGCAVVLEVLVARYRLGSITAADLCNAAQHAIFMAHGCGCPDAVDYRDFVPIE